MIAAKPRPLVTAVAALIVFATFCLLHPERATTGFYFADAADADASSSSPRNEKPYGKDYKGHSTPDDINRVANGTLGFGKVFVVGLPERTDKRDALALTSALTGFNVEWVDGVRGESIADKAVPFRVDRKKLMETNLGSWRGHMNAVRRIIEDDLDSALIMEDDMDWDVRLKPQLELIAAGARAVVANLPDALFPTGRSNPSSPTPASPYGDDWDVLWLGHCGEPFPEDLPENQNLPDSDDGFQAMARKWTILNDATVPPPERVTGLVDFDAHGPPHTRFVHVTAAPMCSFAYALSRAGAQKVLYEMSVAGLAGPFDNALAGMCRRAVGGWSGALARGEDAATAGDREGMGAKCVSVTPPLFFHHKARGLLSGDSDIQEYGGGGGGADGEDDMPEVRERGSTENIMWSARLNLANMIGGKEMVSQWGENS